MSRRSASARATRAKRFIICHNPVEAERDQRRTARGDDRAARSRARADRQAARRRPRTRRPPRRTPAPSARCATTPPSGATCARHPTGRLQIDRAKISRRGQSLDGKYLLSTSDPDLSAEDVALGYKNLLEAERGFRDLKTTLELRPVFHRLEHRIRAHVLLSWLALLLIRVAERHTDHTWRRIALELGRLHLVTLTGPTGTFAQTTQLTATQAELFNACAVTPPPRITALHSA